MRRRLELGLYQKDVARLFGVTEYTVLNWEKRRTESTVNNVPTQFLGYDPAPPAHSNSIADRLKAKRRELGFEHRDLSGGLPPQASTLITRTILRPKILAGSY